METKRLESLDALRGFDMFFIMGFASFVSAVCVACGCGNGWLARQMTHATWTGLTQHDTIFPLFLFIAGASWPYSLAKRRSRGDSDMRTALSCLRRGIVLFVLGLVYGGLLQGNLRVCSVLGRIGFAWMAAAWIWLAFGRRGRVASVVLLLAGYWALLAFVPAPDAAQVPFPPGCEQFGRGPFSPVGNISGWLDRTILPGAIVGFKGVMDNQSVLGVVPATATALLGMMTGEYVKSSPDSGNRKTAAMLVGAAGLAAAGLLVAFGFGPLSMPISKKLWSTSFTLVVGGYSLAMFAAFYWLVDVRRLWRHTAFFRVIGVNSITIYMAQVFVPFKEVSKNFLGGIASLVPEGWGAVVTWAGYTLLCWLFVFFLDRKGVHLKV